MSRTISRLFNSHAEALRVVEALEAAGIPHDDISLLANNAERWHEPRSFAADAGDHPDNEHAAHGLGKGAAIGGAIGGGASLLAGIGMLAIPGMGPVLAAGFLASALTGAAAGAIAGGWMGALRDAGLTEEEANTYAEAVRRGGAVVSARVSEDRAARVEQIMAEHGAVDAAERRRMYEESGWTGFDETRAPYSADEIAAERARFESRI